MGKRWFISSSSESSNSSSTHVSGRRRTVRVFDMFCGAGGSSRGAQMAGAEPVAALDRWELAATTYQMNFPKAIVYRTEAGALSPRRVATDVGEVHLLLASPECTSHSVAKGNKPGCEISRATAFEVVRFAEVLTPRWLVVENVVQMRRWSQFGEWLQALHALGYQTTVGVLDAQYYDTPQARRRLFIVGDLETEPSLPQGGPLTRKTVEGSILGHGESKAHPWRFSPVNAPRRAKATLERIERAIDTLGNNVPFLLVYYGTDGAGGFQTLNRPLRTVTTLDRFAYVKPNGNGHEMRMLQPAELAMAMGFPESHVWPETNRRDRIRLIGNAVCPPVMRAVVQTLIQKQGDRSA